MSMSKRNRATVPAKRRARSPLREIVGDDVYDVWVKMLKKLVPAGRTHRLSVVVASMLAYASSIASSRRDADDDDPAFALSAASGGVDDEEAFRLLKPFIVRLFRDAKVTYERVSSKGERYSILWEATIEFCRWDLYPWEG